MATTLLFVKGSSFQDTKIIKTKSNVTIDCIKNAIYEKTGIPSSHQLLTNSQSIVIDNNNQTLTGYGIINGDTLIVQQINNKKVYKTKHHINDPKSMQIFIKTLSGKKFTLNVESNDIIHTIKAEIYDKTLIPISQQRLIFNGTQLEDDIYLEQYQIKDSSVLFLCVKLIPITIQIKSYLDTHKLTNIYCRDNILSIKHRLFRLTGIDINHQKISFQGKVISNNYDATINTLGIKSGDQLKVEIDLDPDRYSKTAQFIVDKTWQRMEDMNDDYKSLSGKIDELEIMYKDASNEINKIKSISDLDKTNDLLIPIATKAENIRFACTKDMEIASGEINNAKQELKARYDDESRQFHRQTGYSFFMMKQWNDEISYTEQQIVNLQTRLATLKQQKASTQQYLDQHKIKYESIFKQKFRLIPIFECSLIFL